MSSTNGRGQIDDSTIVIMLASFTLSVLLTAYVKGNATEWASHINTSGLGNSLHDIGHFMVEGGKLSLVSLATIAWYPFVGILFLGRWIYRLSRKYA